MLEAGDPAGCGVEPDTDLLVAGRDGQGGGEVGLAGAGWAEEHDVACFAQVSAGCEAVELGPVGGGLVVEPELGHRSAILASVGAVTCGDAVAWCFV